jgi:transcription elongation factor GreA-like protein
MKGIKLIVREIANTTMKKNFSNLSPLREKTAVRKMLKVMQHTHNKDTQSQAMKTNINQFTRSVEVLKKSFFSYRKREPSSLERCRNLQMMPGPLEHSSQRGSHP